MNLQLGRSGREHISWFLILKTLQRQWVLTEALFSEPLSYCSITNTDVKLGKFDLLCSRCSGFLCDFLDEFLIIYWAHFEKLTTFGKVYCCCHLPKIIVFVVFLQKTMEIRPLF